MRNGSGNGMAQKDPYEILGVSRTASQDEIKRKYRQLAKQLHPDRNPGNKQAEERFKELQAAYEVLGDPERRAQYDRFGAGGPRPDFHTWTSPGAGGPTPFDGIDIEFGDLGSIFEQFFRRPGTRRRTARVNRRPQPRGADLEVVVELSFEEAARGCKRDVVLSGGGGGGSQRIEVRIPPGVHDDQRIRVRGQGHAGPGGHGDLMIRCRVRPHPYFRREGDDVFLDLPLTITEAALGTKVEIPTLDGPTVVTVPPGTSSAKRLRLRGKGIRRPGAKSGDMYVVVRIVAPQRLTARARTLLRELSEEITDDPRSGLGWAV